MSSKAVEQQHDSGSGSHQVLTFVLGNETYGVDILRVQEIRGWSAVTKIPHAPAHVLGVLNLRGSIVPIVDLRMRFALERAEYTAVTVIIVMSVNTPAGRRDFGVVVDGVSDVVDVNSAEVKPAPELGSRGATDYIRGLVSVAERMVVLLDIDRLIGRDLALSAGVGESQSDERTDRMSGPGALPSGPTIGTASAASAA
jgi:purine-binding chemotaxis protein CheW